MYTFQGYVYKPAVDTSVSLGPYDSLCHFTPITNCKVVSSHQT